MVSQKRASLLRKKTLYLIGNILKYERTRTGMKYLPYFSLDGSKSIYLHLKILPKTLRMVFQKKKLVNKHTYRNSKPT